MMDLPIEIWMRVLEQIQPDDYFARHRHVKAYCKSSALSPAPESDFYRSAVEQLPLYEKSTWKLTRAYYAISRNSRAAAVKLSLSCQLLRNCSPPHTDFRALAKSNPPVGHLVVELFDRHDLVKGQGKYYRQRTELTLNLHAGPGHQVMEAILRSAVAKHPILSLNREALKAARKIDIIAEMPKFPFVELAQCTAHDLATVLEGHLRARWSLFGLKGDHGEVNIFS